MVYYIEEDIHVSKEKQKIIEAAERAEEVSKKEFEKSFRVYFKTLLDFARQHCPVDTGTLRATIRLEDEPKGGGGLGGRIHNEVERRAGFGKRIVAGGMFINPKTGRICDYAMFVHDGHFTRTGSFVPPRPFLDQAIKEADAMLIKAADKYLAKIGKEWEKE